jgi:hypothetical protein
MNRATIRMISRIPTIVHTTLLPTIASYQFAQICAAIAAAIA